MGGTGQEGSMMGGYVGCDLGKEPDLMNSIIQMAQLEGDYIQP